MRSSPRTAMTSPLGLTWLSSEDKWLIANLNEKTRRKQVENAVLFSDCRGCLSSGNESRIRSLAHNGWRARSKETQFEVKTSKADAERASAALADETAKIGAAEAKIEELSTQRCLFGFVHEHRPPN